jgi:CRP-like cAMP-binding protein
MAYGNNLLSSLSADDLAIISPHLVPVSLPVRKSLERPNRRITTAYFPRSGIASVVATIYEGKQAEVGLIGREGMTGQSLVLGNDRTPYSTYMQVAGEGNCIDAQELTNAMKASETLRDVFLKYAHVFSVQTAHTAISNAHATLVQRLARWLLMAHDRLGTPALPLTHEFMSLMIGARRAGVSDTLKQLRDAKLITTIRGEVTVRDSEGLRRIAGKTYGVPEAEYRRLFGTARK